MLAEGFIFQKLSKEFSSDIQREVRFGSLGGRYIFDGIVRDKGALQRSRLGFYRMVLR